MVEPTPRKTASTADAATGADRSDQDGAAALIDDAVAYYQTNSVELRRLEAGDLQARTAPAVVPSGGPRPGQPCSGAVFPAARIDPGRIDPLFAGAYRRWRTARMPRAVARPPTAP